MSDPSNGKAPRPGADPPVRFRADDLKSSYCNMCNATSTREEVVLNFGVNQSWDRAGAAGEEMIVDLLHRITLSPFAARRFSDALAKLMVDHQARHGPLA